MLINWFNWNLTNAILAYFNSLYTYIMFTLKKYFMSKYLIWFIHVILDRSLCVLHKFPMNKSFELFSAQFFAS